jgi:hypothetical protein
MARHFQKTAQEVGSLEMIRFTQRQAVGEGAPTVKEMETAEGLDDKVFLVDRAMILLLGSHRDFSPVILLPQSC